MESLNYVPILILSMYKIATILSYSAQQMLIKCRRKE